MSIVLDSSAALAVLRNETGAQKVVDALPVAAMSAINKVEVVTRMIDLGQSPDEAEESYATLGVETLAFDESCAFIAARLRADTRHKGLSLADRACLALGLREGKPVMTADRAWADLDLGLEIEVIR